MQMFWAWSPILALGEVMGGAVHVNHSLVVIKKEVGPCHAGLEEDLGPGGKPQPLDIEEAKPILFQLGVALVDQALEMFLSAQGARRDLQGPPAHGQKVVLDEVAIKQLVESPLVADIKQS